LASVAGSGETIENPVTGERITWLETASDSGGESLAFDLYLRAGASVSAEHRHVRQIEQFSVVAGSLRVTVDGRESDLQVGDELTVPAGTAHRWRNVGDTGTQVRVALRPALDTETFFETFFGLARDEQTNTNGIPGLPQIAVAYRDLGDSCPRVTRPPIAVQDAVFALVAPLGRMLGKRGVYARYSPGHPKA
jgi:mannose-6-phosphate isomerase-like protein (cupin superfamily)